MNLIFVLPWIVLLILAYPSYCIRVSEGGIRFKRGLTPFKSIRWNEIHAIESVKLPDRYKYSKILIIYRKNFKPRNIKILTDDYYTLRTVTLVFNLIIFSGKGKIKGKDRLKWAIHDRKKRERILMKFLAE